MCFVYVHVYTEGPHVWGHIHVYRGLRLKPGISRLFSSHLLCQNLSLNPYLGLLASLCSQLDLGIPLSTPQALGLPMGSHVYPAFTGFWGSENSGFQAYTTSNLPTSPSPQTTPTLSFYICLSFLSFMGHLKGLLYLTNLIVSQASIA